MALTVIARLKVKSGCEAQAEQALRAMVAKVRGEDGTVHYIMYRSTQEPGRFVVYEVYQDQQSFDFHSNTPHMKELGAAIGPLLDGQPRIEILNELDRK